MSNIAPNDPASMQCWPLAGFAPGMYSCKCADCARSYVGEKRSYNCLECAVKKVIQNVQVMDKDRRALSDELMKADERSSHPQETIVAAAVYHGCTISLPPPSRHGHVLFSMTQILGVGGLVPPENQGFLTSTGRFVNRVEAKLIAFKAKQIIQHSAGEHCPELYSEDLW